MKAVITMDIKIKATVDVRKENEHLVKTAVITKEEIEDLKCDIADAFGCKKEDVTIENASLEVIE
jgi:predicted nucleic acid-binding protein